MAPCGREAIDPAQRIRNSVRTGHLRDHAGRHLDRDADRGDEQWSPCRTAANQASVRGGAKRTLGHAHDRQARLGVQMSAQPWPPECRASPDGATRRSSVIRQ